MSIPVPILSLGSIIYIARKTVSHGKCKADFADPLTPECRCELEHHDHGGDDLSSDVFSHSLTKTSPLPTVYRDYRLALPISGSKKMGRE